jgi:hypothetical protein
VAERHSAKTSTFVVEIEEATGPGLEVTLGRGSRPRAKAVRDGLWLGADRGALFDSDDGRGRRLAVLVALPSSTFPGLQVETEIVGGFRAEEFVSLVGRVPGAELPIEAFLRVLARAGAEARWIDAREARAAARAARHVYRVRRGEGRILGGRAWRPAEGTTLEDLRFTTSHSGAEYRLDRVPPRFLRALEGLLDDDERILYWVARPGLGAAGLLDRLRGSRVDRRAAMLLLSDRQLLWLVDHAEPDRTLIDWGADVDLVPVEAIRDLTLELAGPLAVLRVATNGGRLTARLPAELGEEAEVMRRLLVRFVPDPQVRVPLRRYELAELPFDTEPASRFGQGDEARAALETLSRRHGDAVAFLFSPRRSGQRQTSACLVTHQRIILVDGDTEHVVDPATLGTVRLVLSPLVGRLILSVPGAEHRLTYPAPFDEAATGLVRRLRRLWANAPGGGAGVAR